MSPLPGHRPLSAMRLIRRNKYGATRIRVDGHLFDSKREATRYRGLRALLRAGAIRDLELQPAFALPALGGKKVATYRADFRYLRVSNGEEVVEDVKGMRTPMYRLKKKWVEAEYMLTIDEV